MTEAHSSKTSNITDSLANKSLRVSTILVETGHKETHTHLTNTLVNIKWKIGWTGCNANLFSRAGRAVCDVQEIRQAFVRE